VANDRDRRAASVAPGPVALFIDWDNFAIGLRQEMPDRPADVGPILRWARRFGPLLVCRAYGEWRDPAERLAIYNAGVEVVYAPVLPLGGSVMARDGGGAKSLADTAMAVDVTEMLSLIPGLSSVILATSDKDLIPVLRFAQRRGLHAVVIGSDRTAGALRELADEFVSYRQLLELESGATAPLSRPATVPPMRVTRGPRAFLTPVPSTSASSAAALPVPSASQERRSARGATTVTTGTSTAPAPSTPAPRPSVGSVFANEEEEAAGEPAGPARRRRRGGRRRRAGELAAGGEPEAVEEVAEPGTVEPVPPEAEEAAATPATMAAPAAERTTGEPSPAGEERGARATPDAIRLTASSPVAGEDSAPPAGEPSRTLEAIAAGPSAPEARPNPPPAAERPPERRAPVVLPGERLRRLAPAAPPVAPDEPTPTEAPAAGERVAASSAPGGTEETESPESQEIEQSVAAPAPPAVIDGTGDGTATRGVRRGRRRGRARSEASTAGETTEVSTPELEGGEPEAQASAAGSAPQPPEASVSASVGESSDAVGGASDGETESAPADEGTEAGGSQDASARSTRRPRRRGGKGR
jgi:hypothetical protein